MSKTVQSIRGMHDVLPADSFRWQTLESRLRQWVKQYAYREIRTPVMEATELFKRSIGDVTDIVEKEMYTFDDRNGDSLTLRPEGTACVARAGIQHGLFYNQVQRLWYQGKMYRHERPQKGRYREFCQFGVEAYGITTPDIEAEQLAMTADLWSRLGLQNVRLEINSLGLPEERDVYRSQLIEFYESHADSLGEDEKKRLHTNPLRILDSKNPAVKAINESAPVLWDCLGDESKAHFERLQELLTATGIEYQVNPRLVRGLDYYCHTVFEWITDDLGAQGTICAGGRYDGLVQQLGGKPAPAFGFAMGLERILALLEQVDGNTNDDAPELALLYTDDASQNIAFINAQLLRNKDISVYTHCGGGSLKNQLKRVDKMGINHCIIFSDDELSGNQVIVKNMRANEQIKIAIGDIVTTVEQLVKGK